MGGCDRAAVGYSLRLLNGAVDLAEGGAEFGLLLDALPVCHQLLQQRGRFHGDSGRREFPRPHGGLSLVGIDVIDGWEVPVRHPVGVEPQERSQVDMARRECQCCLLAGPVDQKLAD